MHDNLRLDRISNARLQMIKKDPFIGFVAQKCPIIFRDDLDTAATNGRDLLFSRTFIDSISDQEILFVLYHEIMHIVLNHVSRGKDKNQKRFNIACDIVINDTLKIYEILPDKFEPIYGSQFKIRGQKNTAENVYEMLPKELNVKTLDNHEIWDELSSKEVEGYLSDIVEKAKQAGMVQHRFDHLFIRHSLNLETKTKRSSLKPLIEKYLNHYINDYSFNRLDYRYEDILMPHFNPDRLILKNVWVLIDVSGSVKKDDLEIVFLDLIHLSKQYTSLSFELSFFSTIVTKPVKMRSITQIKESSHSIKTSGGTSFDVIFESYQKDFTLQRKPEMMIIYTDGKCRINQPNLIPKVPIFWVLTDKISHELPGTKIYI